LNLKRNRQTRRGIFANRPLLLPPAAADARAVEERAAACAGDVGAGLGAEGVSGGVLRRGLPFPLALVVDGGEEERRGAVNWRGHGARSAANAGSLSSRGGGKATP